MALVAGAVTVAAVLFVIIIYIVGCIGWAMMFKKAGKPAILAFIPIVNFFVHFKLVWKLSVWVVWFVVGVVLAIIAAVGAGTMMAGVASVISGIYGFVMHIMLCQKTSHAYGHGAGFAIGFFFFPWIFSLITGLGNSQYVGNPSEK